MSLKFSNFFDPRNVAWVGQKWPEKIFPIVVSMGLFVVQYLIGDLRAKFQLDGEFCLGIGIGKILTNSTEL